MNGQDKHLTVMRLLVTMEKVTFLAFTELPRTNSGGETVPRKIQLICFTLSYNSNNQSHGKERNKGTASYAAGPRSAYTLKWLHRPAAVLIHTFC